MSSPSLAMSPAGKRRLDFHVAGELARGEDKIKDLDFPGDVVRRGKKIRSDLPGDFVRGEEKIKMLDFPGNFIRWN